MSIRSPNGTIDDLLQLRPRLPATATPEQIRKAPTPEQLRKALDQMTPHQTAALSRRNESPMKNFTFDPALLAEIKAALKLSPDALMRRMSGAYPGPADVAAHLALTELIGKNVSELAAVAATEPTDTIGHVRRLAAVMLINGERAPLTTSEINHFTPGSSVKNFDASTCKPHS